MPCSNEGVLHRVYLEPRRLDFVKKLCSKAKGASRGVQPDEDVARVQIRVYQVVHQHHLQHCSAPEGRQLRVVWSAGAPRNVACA